MDEVDRVKLGDLVGEMDHHDPSGTVFLQEAILLPRGCQCPGRRTVENAARMRVERQCDRGGMLPRRSRAEFLQHALMASMDAVEHSAGQDNSAVSLLRQFLYG